MQKTCTLDEIGCYSTSVKEKKSENLTRACMIRVFCLLRSYRSTPEIDLAAAVKQTVITVESVKSESRACVLSDVTQICEHMRHHIGYLLRKMSRFITEI